MIKSCDRPVKGLDHDRKDRKKALANRANALKSSGPKTPEGKAVVSTNATRHGIFSSRLILVDEKQADFAHRVALDNELYKAIRNLREQQEWRIKNGTVIEGEAA